MPEKPGYPKRSWVCINSLSKIEKFSFPSGQQQEEKVTGHDEAEGCREEKALLRDALGTAAKLEIQ